MHRLNLLALVTFVVAACSETPSAPVASAPVPPTPKAPPAPTEKKPADEPAPVAAPTPPPPSTGRELPAAKAPPKPALTPEVAQKLLAEVAPLIDKDPSLCEGALSQLVQTLRVAAPRPTKETLPYYDTARRCAFKLKRWQTLLELGYRVLRDLPEQAAPASIVRALIGLARYDDAAKEAARFKEAFPNDRELTAVIGLLACEMKRWDACVTVAKQLVDTAADAGAGADLQRARGWYFGTISTYMLGRLDIAAAALAELAKIAPNEPMLPHLQKAIASAQMKELVIEGNIETTIPLGTYHLFGTRPDSIAGSVVSVELRNTAQRARELRIEGELLGLTDKSTRTVTLMPGAADVVRLVPPLKAGFDLGSVRGERPTSLSFRVIEALPTGDRVLWEETKEVKVLSRDMLPLMRKIASDAYKPTRELSAAWVTPNAKTIDAFLAKAKARAPRQTFAGEQMPTLPQVKAIWDELKARGVSYVMDPDVASDLGLVQRTRLPTEVLESTNAQCLESSILFATLLEAIGLRPVLTFVPGHAFVGWHTVEESGLPAGTIVYVETTMVHDAPFEAAVKTAIARVVEETEAGNFEHGVSHRLEVADLRERGIQPQPVE